MKQYKLVKNTQRDDCDCGFKKISIGYFPSRSSAFKFAHHQDNVEMWKQEYKKTMAIITLSIELEIYKDGDLDNVEVLWIFE